MTSLTPLAYASNIARTGADMTARSACAASVMFSRRASTSPGTAAGPAISAHCPAARRRSYSIWNSRSWAQARPIANQASAADPALMCGMPKLSRTRRTSSRRPETPEKSVTD